ncbi:cysteine proteinase inhibitor B-like [Impatiens glandulifera]|uniref:cysteine proteinase inhibitor B-like n=1 Tax=Impatiens glandulifera TaxID=253017 RepID=UPI001FB04E80|nr:cysteine proteinase inhibitor B-like [Impatiens glandulifera]
MARPTAVTVIAMICLLAHYSEAIGGLIGGRTKVKNVKTNKEIQDLGRFSVEQYNNMQKSIIGSQNGGGGGYGDVKFREVVEAETQVVSGIKYYMKISTVVTKSGATKTFDAVLVVKPWITDQDKQLLKFTPSSPSSSSSTTSTK